MDIEERISQHHKKINSNIHLQNAIQKYGREKFIIEITEYPSISLPELIEIEQSLLDKHVGLPLCYNTSLSAAGGKVCEINPNYGKIKINNGIGERFISPEEEIPEGFILGGLPKSEEFKQNLSEAWKGEKNPKYGKRCYTNGLENIFISPGEEIPEGFILGGKPHSKETKQKQSEAKKGIKKSEEHKQKLSEAKRGKKRTEESRKKQSKAIKGEKNHMFGKTPSEEAKYKSKIKQGNRVITSICCYYSMTDALKELNIGRKKFNKLFEKDPSTGFYIEIATQ